MPKEMGQLLAERYLAAYNDHAPEKVPEICTQNVEWDGETISRNDLPARVQMWIDAFPDITMDLGTVVMDDEHVAFRFTFSGTHEGDFQGIEPTGNSVELPVMIMMSIDGEKIDGLWYELDELELFKQLDKLELLLEES